LKPSAECPDDVLADAVPPIDRVAAAVMDSTVTVGSPNVSARVV
jgi:hypothetical protein